MMNFAKINLFYSRNRFVFSSYFKFFLLLSNKLMHFKNILVKSFDNLYIISKAHLFKFYVYSINFLL